MKILTLSIGQSRSLSEEKKVSHLWDICLLWGWKLFSDSLQVNQVGTYLLPVTLQILKSSLSCHSTHHLFLPHSLLTLTFSQSKLSQDLPLNSGLPSLFLTRYFRNLAISLKYFPINKNKNSWHVGAMGGLTPTPWEIEEKGEAWKRARWRKSGIGQWEDCPVGGCSGS